jgi:GTP-binding protein
MELKLVADAGIIGYPSVGKSSLIAAVSHARPKIADYPFTTLVPNLGVVSVAGREFVLCDVPGLIEGASDGKGLGHAFLKHIERCGILIHLLDVSRDDIVADYKAIRKELKNHSPALAERREFVVLNKVDLVGNDAAPWLAALKKAKIKVFGSISAATHHGTKDLMKALLPAIIEERDRRRLTEEILNDNLDDLPVLKPHLLVDRMGAFRIQRQDEGVLLVNGKRIERLVAMTDLQSIGAVNRLRNVFERIGLRKAIEREMKPGDRVFVGEKRVDEAIW